MTPEIQTLIDAGLKPRHVARLLHVSRSTVSHWLNGHNPPNRWITEDVRTLAETVAKLVKDGKLPVRAGQLTPTEVDAKTYFLVATAMPRVVRRRAFRRPPLAAEPVQEEGNST
jgi:predicted transcriptional regulator